MPEQGQDSKGISVIYDTPEDCKAESKYPEMDKQAVDENLQSEEEKIIDTQKDFQPPQESMDEKEEEPASIPEGDQKEEPEINVSEKLIAFLDTSETSLNKAKTQVNSIRNIIEEMTFKLDSFMSILDIIHSNEERKMEGPKATTTGQKETKDTLDEILEVLQNPAFQSMLRQFMMSFIGKNNKAIKPES